MREHLRVDVAVGAVPADVQLILCGFLVHGIIKVDGVGVSQAPVLPHQRRSEHQQSRGHCGQTQARGRSPGPKDWMHPLSGAGMCNLPVGNTT